MVKKRDPRCNTRLPGPVQHPPEGYRRLRGLPLNFCFPNKHALMQSEIAKLGKPTFHPPDRAGNKPCPNRVRFFRVNAWQFPANPAGQSAKHALSRSRLLQIAIFKLAAIRRSSTPCGICIPPLNFARRWMSPQTAATPPPPGHPGPFTPREPTQVSCCRPDCQPLNPRAVCAGKGDVRAGDRGGRNKSRRALSVLR